MLGCGARARAALWGAPEGGSLIFDVVKCKGAQVPLDRRAVGSTAQGLPSVPLMAWELEADGQHPCEALTAEGQPGVERALLSHWALRTISRMWHGPRFRHLSYITALSAGWGSSFCSSFMAAPPAPGDTAAAHLFLLSSHLRVMQKAPERLRFSKSHSRRTQEYLGPFLCLSDKTLSVSGTMAKCWKVLKGWWFQQECEYSEDTRIGETNSPSHSCEPNVREGDPMQEVRLKAISGAETMHQAMLILQMCSEVAGQPRSKHPCTDPALAASWWPGPREVVQPAPAPGSPMPQAEQEGGLRVARKVPHQEGGFGELLRTEVGHTGLCSISCGWELETIKASPTVGIIEIARTAKSNTWCCYQLNCKVWSGLGKQQMSSRIKRECNEAYEQQENPDPTNWLDASEA
ncbi:hypothetical protein Anapl_07315 [Anas platyrhynchos]|uniref:Uncharacterized protein n=1 Tax=Anas platyrhynchos TaxID=8839 RepID=R0JPV1_ANAPL|nr:hypothetical protein Anapl_07315 [Anas platyrhynchos]